MRGSTLGAILLSMHWLNIEIIRTQGPEYTSAEPAQQLAWFHLLLYCAQQENGGIIRGASAFTDRQWQRLMDVDGETIRSRCALWLWDSEGNLVVWEYPEKQEQSVQAKREGGRKGGRSPKSHASYASSIPSSTPSSYASSTPSRNALTKEEEEEELKGEVELKQESKEESESVPASPRKRADARPQTAMDVVTYGMTLEPALPPVEAQRYWDYYQSNGWKVGRNPMKDWKAAVRNWQRNASIATPPTNGNHSRPNRTSSRNGEGYTLSPERAAWLDADKLDGPPSHRD